MVEAVVAITIFYLAGWTLPYRLPGYCYYCCCYTTNYSIGLYVPLSERRAL